MEVPNKRGIQRVAYNHSQYIDFNPVRDGKRGGEQKGPTPTSFFSVTSTNVGISTQTSLTFSFNPFATLV